MSKHNLLQYFMAVSAALVVASTSLAQTTVQVIDCQGRKSQLPTSPNGIYGYIQGGGMNDPDVLHYHIDLDVTNFNAQVIRGGCTLTFTPRQAALDSLHLYLEGLSVDSIKQGNQHLAFVHTGMHLDIALASPLAPQDTADVTIWYGGNPIIDATGWGGFYFNGQYAFNLGVGFDANPHNYGRVWHPCVDNFTERATYTFAVTVPTGKNAHCNGYLVSETNNGGTSTYRWQMDEPIPTYLACVAIADYATLRYTYQGELGPVDVELCARPADTTALKGSFTHLDDALACFEHWYGPYRWNKIGYSLVPFGSGAMEHATNISYPAFAANGQLNYESLMAHEFSHHWWGDLATCETAPDMWLNEGIASFSEHLFKEWRSGRDEYMKDVINNHLNVLLTANDQEGGYRAVSGVPHEYTYGKHVYNKGATVMHNLRGYLGDSLFRVGLRAVTDQTQFTHHNSYDFRDRLTAATGLDLTNFFEDWVFSPGFSHFEADTLRVMPDGNGQYNVTVLAEQKTFHAPHPYNGVPTDFSFIDANGNRAERSAWLGGDRDSATFTLPFAPEHVITNGFNKVTYARGDVDRNYTTTGSYTLTPARFILTVQAIADTSWVRVEHHYVRPDTAGTNPNGWQFSANHYWSVFGDFPAGSGFRGLVYYDKGSGGEYLDLDLVNVTEDSITLLWRAHPWDAWEVYPDFVKNTLGNPNNGYGLFLINDLRAGDYTFANAAPPVGIQQPSASKNNAIKLFPNPATHELRVEWNGEAPLQEVMVSNASGNVVMVKQCDGERQLLLDISGLPSGAYFLTCKGMDGRSVTSKFVKRK